MKMKLWELAFLITHGAHRLVLWFACWTEFVSARCAFRAIGNTKFKNERHNFARFETISQDPS
jgi:hypothetical protein